jgi:hypothetical protein
MSGAVGSVFDGMYLHGSREFAIHPTNPGGGKASRVSDAFEGGAAPKMVSSMTHVGADSSEFGVGDSSQGAGPQFEARGNVFHGAVHEGEP